MIGSLITAILPILGKAIPDADKRVELAQELATLAEKQAHEVAIAQIEVNKAEAASGGWFKGGWRPMIGWVCAAAFAYHFVLERILEAVFMANGINVALPDLDMGPLMAVLGGMLGLGGLRTYEKTRGPKK